jgi:hypothetical protein
MQKKQFLVGFFKPIILFIGALYALGVPALFLQGKIFDALLPYESIFCIVVSVVLFVWFGKAFLEFAGLLFRKEVKPL